MKFGLSSPGWCQVEKVAITSLKEYGASVKLANSLFGRRLSQAGS
jgi:hypothetical protein